MTYIRHAACFAQGVEPVSVRLGINKICTISSLIYLN